MEYRRGELLAEGKTKRIWKACDKEDHPLLGFVIVENKDEITAFDDPSKTRRFATKAQHATTTACRVFELLRREGIPVAYVTQLSPTEFVAPMCAMIPLEAVGRRYAVGSYLKRHPELEKKELPPHRFDEVVVEFFLKTTHGKLTVGDGEVLVDGLDPRKGEEDPLIINPYDVMWDLFHSKKPQSDPEADLRWTVSSKKVFGNRSGAMLVMASVLRRTFLILEEAWKGLGLHFVDFKVEFGTSIGGKLVVGDVIDNDSWRLMTTDWSGDLSKQAFRDGQPLDEVERKYGTVARLAERLHK